MTFNPLIDMWRSMEWMFIWSSVLATAASCIWAIRLRWKR